MKKQTAILRRLTGVAAAAALLLTLAGCSSFATFLADSIPEWAGGLPKDAPPRPGDPRYADYFRTQIAAQRQVADAQAREQAARIERAQIAAGHVEHAHSARSVVRGAESAHEPETEPAAADFSLSGRALY